MPTKTATCTIVLNLGRDQSEWSRSIVTFFDSSFNRHSPLRAFHDRSARLSDQWWPVLRALAASLISPAFEIVALDQADVVCLDRYVVVDIKAVAHYKDVLIVLVAADQSQCIAAPMPSLYRHVTLGYPRRKQPDVMSDARTVAFLMSSSRSIVEASCLLTVAI